MSQPVYQAQLVVVGLSHATAPVDLLERVSLPDENATALIGRVRAEADAGGAMLLSTCGRTELYAELEPGSTAADRLPGLLADLTGQQLDTLLPHLYVHTAEHAVRHLFTVTCGLDSIVIGEEQILGQVKDALQRAQRLGASGQALHRMVQSALQTGKQVRATTGLNKAGRDLATAGIDRFERHVGPLAGRTALIVGAGSMAAVVAAALRRAGAARIDVANRTPERAQHLADTAGGRGGTLRDVPRLLADADVVVTCAGGTGTVLDAATVRRVTAGRPGRTLFVLDLALPRNVEAGVAAVPGVSLVDLDALAAAEAGDPPADDVGAAAQLVDAAVDEFLAGQRIARVGPVLAAMRSSASTALTAELTRLAHRVPSLDDRAHDEIARALRRVVDKWLHQPTVRARQLAGLPHGDVYLGVLGELFAPAGTGDTDNKSEVLV